MIYNVYADSLFKLANQENSLERTIEQFENFMLLADSNPDWIVLLDAPTIRNRVKIKLLTDLKVFETDFINFLMTLIRNHHIRYYNDIYENWIELARYEQKVAYIQLYTAKPLTKKELNAIKEDIQPVFPNLDIEFRIKIDTSLIRGIKLVYQGKSIERSIRRSLEEMKTSI